MLPKRSQKVVNCRKLNFVEIQRFSLYDGMCKLGVDLTNGIDISGEMMYYIMVMMVGLIG